MTEAPQNTAIPSERIDVLKKLRKSIGPLISTLRMRNRPDAPLPEFESKLDFADPATGTDFNSLVRVYILKFSSFTHVV